MAIGGRLLGHLALLAVRYLASQLSQQRVEKDAGQRMHEVDCMKTSGLAVKRPEICCQLTRLDSIDSMSYEMTTQSSSDESAKTRPFVEATFGEVAS